MTSAASIPKESANKNNLPHSWFYPRRLTRTYGAGGILPAAITVGSCPEIIMWKIPYCAMDKQSGLLSHMKTDYVGINFHRIWS